MAGCTASKSADPLSPTVAGPIPGVSITPPSIVQPDSGAKVAVDQQPLVLVVVNAATSGVRPLTYVFEIAADAGFANKVFIREGIAPGDGRTSLRLPDSLAAGRTYFWRARAEDGANTGPFSSTAAFEVFTPIVIGAPVSIAPIDNTKTESLHPRFTFFNAPRSGPVGRITYRLEVSDSDSFANKIAVWMLEEQQGQTALDAPADLPASKQLFWHVRVVDPAGPWLWSTTQVFQTPTPVVVPPPSGGGGGGGGASCGPPYPNNGDALVACISAKYPERLVAGVSLAQRAANMAFLRDRMIETGICGGMDLGWNRKGPTGTGDVSVDGLAWRDGGVPYFVDIGLGYDDTSRPLQLIWLRVGPTPGFSSYSPRPACN